jgi:hypothetical protein
MTMECSEIIKQAVEHLELSFKCVPLEDRTCIITPYLYPDNDLIELFIEDIGSGKFRVTDLGETLRHLESQGLDLFSSRKRRFLLNQIIERIHVNLNNGRLEKEGDLQQIGSLITDLAESAHTVSDLIYTSKAYEPATFPEEVSNYLKEHDIEHQRNYKVTGSKTSSNYKVDIYIDGERPTPTLVDTLSPPQESAIKTTVNRTFRKWYDINGGRRKITLLNDIDYTWKNEDIKLLSDFSIVQKWSSKERFLDIVGGD